MTLTKPVVKTGTLQEGKWRSGWWRGRGKGGRWGSALTRVMGAVVPIPAVASVSVLHSAVVGGSVVGVVRPL